jgi:cystathionine beta-synthase
VHRVFNSILDCIGDTPMVRLNKVTEGLPGTLYAKVEFMNPAGSIKDRMARQIIEDAEASGELKPGGTVVEGTSGNTGAGLAMMSAIRGYKSTFVMPDKQSEEKRAALRAWGSRVVITPTNVDPDDPRSYYEVSRRLVEESDNSFYANQYHNPSNPKAHYLSTAPELYKQLDGKIDVIFAGLGTGGTISGIAKYIKEQNPNIQIVGIDPVGSLYYDYFKTGQPTQPFTYLVEGIGEDFLPSTMDFENVDEVVRVNDRECFLMTRRLVREEGIFCGASSGAAVAGALKYLRRQERKDLVSVVILPDSGRSYLSKVFNDKWMEENGFLSPENNLGHVADLIQARGPRKLISSTPEASVGEAIETFKKHGISQMPLIQDDHVVGVVAERTLLQRALEGKLNAAVSEVADMNYSTVDPGTEITVLTEMFRRYRLAIVYQNSKPVDIITRIDLIDYISRVTGGQGRTSV